MRKCVDVCVTHDWINNQRGRGSIVIKYVGYRYHRKKFTIRHLTFRFERKLSNTVQNTVGLQISCFIP